VKSVVIVNTKLAIRNDIAILVKEQNVTNSANKNLQRTPKASPFFAGAKAQKKV